MIRPAQGRPFYYEYAWAYDYLIERPVPKDCDGIAALIAARGVLPPSRFLDAGCGTGRYAIELAVRGFRVTGLDVSSELIDQARRRQIAGAAFEVGDLLELKAPAPYDGILCCGVLNDLVKEPERRAAFRVFARALRPDGVLVLDVREWQGTARKKTREPVFEKAIDTPRGGLRFRSVTTLDQVNHQLLVHETHELRANRRVSSAKFDFTMCRWTREELALHLAEAGFTSGEYSDGYDPTAPAGESDRLVAVATHP
jgi:SAM-dependent methyltransferase